VTQPLPNLSSLRAYVEKETQRRADAEYWRIMKAGHELLQLCLALDPDWDAMEVRIRQHLEAQAREQVTAEIEQQYGSVVL
jgi:hypothetical protein